MLSRLAEIGMEIAEAAGRQAAAAEGSDAPPLRDPALAYARVARAVRMTIALQSRLAKDLSELDRAEGKAAAAKASVRRSRLHRLVEQAIEAGRAGDEDFDEDEIERLSTEAWERLTDAADEADFAGCAPLAEVVARICEDLQLSPDWTARLMAAAGVGASGPEPPPPPPCHPGKRAALIRDPGGSAPAPGSRVSAPLRPG